MITNDRGSNFFKSGLAYLFVYVDMLDNCVGTFPHFSRGHIYLPGLGRGGSGQ